IKVMHGQEWARTVLQVFSWIALCGSVGWLGYSAIEERHIHLIDVVHGGIFLLLTAVPPAVLILLLRREPGVDFCTIPLRSRTDLTLSGIAIQRTHVPSFRQSLLL